MEAAQAEVSQQRSLAMMSAKLGNREGVRLAALCPSWTLAQAVQYLGEEMGLENLCSVHSPCRKEGLYWTHLWDSSRLWRVWSRIQFPSPPRGSCWAPRQRFQCGTWSSWGLKTKPHISSFAFLCKPQVLSFPSQHSDIRLRGPFFQYLFGAKSQPLPDAAPGQWAAWVHLELGRSKPPPWWWEQGAALHHSLWAPLSLGWVSCPQCIPGTSWIAWNWNKILKLNNCPTVSLQVLSEISETESNLLPCWVT